MPRGGALAHEGVGLDYNERAGDQFDVLVVRLGVWHGRWYAAVEIGASVWDDSIMVQAPKVEHPIWL